LEGYNLADVCKLENTAKTFYLFLKISLQSPPLNPSGVKYAGGDGLLGNQAFLII